MSIRRPFKRTVRQYLDGEYAEGGRGRYVHHPKFASDPVHYVRGFLTLQKDVISLFDYVEPADENLECYSFRIFELFVRACIEIEANFKAILSDNEYQSKNNLTMHDYCKIERSHKLSSYKVKCPVWRGEKNIYAPFSEWSCDGKKIPWYSDYSNCKHDRAKNFDKANLCNLMNAITGLAAVLSSQFMSSSFLPGLNVLVLENPSDGFESAIGDYFMVEYPKDWPDNERYDFSYHDWIEMAQEEDPFTKFQY